MKYYRINHVSEVYQKISCFLKPLSNVLIGAIIIVGFCSVSYRLILGGEVTSKLVDNTTKTEVSEEVKSVFKESSGMSLANVNIEKVKVYLTEEKRVVELPLEEYIKGVLSSEMPLSFNKEALKAQAIAARTYTVAHVFSNTGCANGNGADLCDTVHCQVYTPKEKKLEQLGAEGDSKWELVEQVVEETKGRVLTYNGEIVEGAFYFSTSGGRTENVEDVFSAVLPYLRSVESAGEEVAPRYKESKSIDKYRFIQTINGNYSKANLTDGNLESQITINSYTEGGSVKEIALGNINISGVDFRRLFGLNSANFTLEFLNNEIVINCMGFGHGVGMSQWGANVMAGQGKTCEEIIKHYYTGVEIASIKQ